MTLQPAYAVDGGPINGLLIRRQLQSATRGSSGVVEALDLRVRPLAVPGAGFVIGDGAAVIKGKATAWDGSYYALNIGDHTVSDVPGTGSGGGRHDMVVLRVMPGAVVEPYIIQGVSSTATTIEQTPEPNLSAIPLARIAYPASTATITAGMITDLRTMLAPRRHRELRTQFGQGDADGRMDYADYKADYERLPQRDWGDTGDLVIPSWATQLQVRADWINMVYPAPSTTTGVDARGKVRIGLIGSGGNNLYSRHSVYNFNQQGINNAYRCSIGLADTMTIPTAMRGMAVTLRMYAQADSTTNHYLLFDGWANAAVDMEFREVPAAAAML